MLTTELIEITLKLSQKLRDQSQTITTVESCTGGLVAASITSLPGSSDIYPGGYITYSNQLKQSMVGVSLETLKVHGAVSWQTATEMARGGAKILGTSYAIAITGIAGPDGGSHEKPVGTVWICIAGQNNQLDCRRFLFPGDRSQIRTLSAITTLSMALQILNAQTDPIEHEQERHRA